MRRKDTVLKDENGKPIASKVYIPSYGKCVCFGINAVVEWLNSNNILGRHISSTAVKNIALGRGKLLGYADRTIEAVQKQFPDLCKEVEEQKGGVE